MTSRFVVTAPERLDQGGPAGAQGLPLDRPGRTGGRHDWITLAMPTEQV